MTFNDHGSFLREREMVYHPPYMPDFDPSTTPQPISIIRESMRRPVNQDIETISEEEIIDGIGRAIMIFEENNPRRAVNLNLILSKKLYEKLKTEMATTFDTKFELVQMMYRSYIRNICYSSTMKSDMLVINDNQTGKEIGVTVIKIPTNKFELGFDGED